MSASNGKDLLNTLAQDLRRLQKYERLLETQEKLVEKGEFDTLPGVLDKKARVLAKIESLRNGAALSIRTASSGDSGKNGKKVEELLARFIVKVKEVETREQASLHKARLGRAELSEQLRAIHRGKKLLRGYKPQKSDGKARFKDIKT